jgi:NAD dependent epimerase/dehydratase family enzyme
LLPVPAFALRLAFGQMADEALLASTRVTPSKLLGAGFRFTHPSLDKALAAALG